MTDRIQLGHGGGGQLMRNLIRHELLPLLPGTTAEQRAAAVLKDAVVLPPSRKPLAFSCDGYVVFPLEFPGGDIGSLAVTGTANDLAMVGARPQHLSVSLILEEGLPLALLRRVVASMAAAADDAGISIATGDTKVVERGKADGLFISTSGIGVVEAMQPITPTAITPGDALLVSGDLGRHGVAILAARHGLDLQPAVLSDCAPLWPLVEGLLNAGVTPHCLRDLTRGGLAAALQELAEDSGCDLVVEESLIPVSEAVVRCCELLGFDPLHLANEGRCLVVVPAGQVETALAMLAVGGGAVVGRVLPPPQSGPSQVTLRTPLGTSRLLTPHSGELLPRIC